MGKEKMDIRKIKKLIELLEESGIAEIEIKEGEESVRISRHSSAPAPVHYQVPMAAQMPMQAPAAAAAAWSADAVGAAPAPPAPTTPPAAAAVARHRQPAAGRRPYSGVAGRRARNDGADGPGSGRPSAGPDQSAVSPR